MIVTYTEKDIKKPELLNDTIEQLWFLFFVKTTSTRIYFNLFFINGFQCAILNHQSHLFNNSAIDFTRIDVAL